jgi:hypothetical protein
MKVNQYSEMNVRTKTVYLAGFRDVSINYTFGSEAL